MTDRKRKRLDSFTKETATLYSHCAEEIQAERLYQDNYAKIRAYLISRNQSEELVEEVLQDLYLKLMSLENLSQIQNPGAYLLRMANNLRIDALRRQNRENNRLSVDPLEKLQLIAADPSPIDEIFSRQQLKLCEKALAELPPDYKKILLMNRLEGVTHSQIAKSYGRSTSWVEKIIIRTVTHCRRKMEQLDRE